MDILPRLYARVTRTCTDDSTLASRNVTSYPDLHASDRGHSEDAGRAFNHGEAWLELDENSLQSQQDRIREWTNLLGWAEQQQLSSGHPHFRLGLECLLVDQDESRGLEHLEKAYEQDKQWNPKRAHRAAAYRILCLMKDFLKELKSKNDDNPEKLQLGPGRRGTLMTTLLLLYDQTRKDVMDMRILTYQPLFKLIRDDNLRIFAGQNYYCAQEILELTSTYKGQSLALNHEYALARAVIVMYGGVLEAILADMLPGLSKRTLGTLIKDAYSQNILTPGTKLAALSSVMLYFRNHIHADKTRTEYFVDLNVAKGCKVALESVILELYGTR
jgi:hypothetical protein